MKFLISAPNKRNITIKTATCILELQHGDVIDSSLDEKIDHLSKSFPYIFKEVVEVVGTITGGNPEYTKEEPVKKTSKRKKKV